MAEQAKNYYKKRFMIIIFYKQANKSSSSVSQKLGNLLVFGNLIEGLLAIPKMQSDLIYLQV